MAISRFANGASPCAALKNSGTSALTTSVHSADFLLPAQSACSVREQQCKSLPLRRSTLILLLPRALRSAQARLQNRSTEKYLSDPSRTHSTFHFKSQAARHRPSGLSIHSAANREQY